MNNGTRQQGGDQKIELGRFMGKAVEYDFGETAQGNPQICVVCEITEGDYKGRQYLWYGFFNTKDNTERTFQSLMYFGWNGKEIDKLEGLGSKEAQCVLEEDVYDGKKRTRVAFVNAAGSDGIAMKKRYSPQERVGFAARLKGNLVEFQQSGKASSALEATKEAPTAGRSATLSSGQQRSGGGAPPSQGRQPAAPAQQQRDLGQPVVDSVIPF